MEETPADKDAIRCQWLEAFRARDISAMERLIDAGDRNYLELTIDESTGRHPIIDASSQGDLEMIELFLSHSFPVHFTDRTGHTALHLAVKGNHLECVMELLDGRGLDLNFTTWDEYGWTALHYAAAYGHTLIVYHLIKQGANPNVLDRWQRTALHVACIGNHLDITAFLLSRRANADIQDKVGNSAIFYVNLATMAALLLQHGKASLALKNKRGQSAFQVVPEPVLNYLLALEDQEISANRDLVCGTVEELRQQLLIRIDQLLSVALSKGGDMYLGAATTLATTICRIDEQNHPLYLEAKSRNLFLPPKESLFRQSIYGVSKLLTGLMIRDLAAERLNRRDEMIRRENEVKRKRFFEQSMM